MRTKPQVRAHMTRSEGRWRCVRNVGARGSNPLTSTMDDVDAGHGGESAAVRVGSQVQELPLPLPAGRLLRPSEV